MPIEAWFVLGSGLGLIAWMLCCAWEMKWTREKEDKFTTLSLVLVLASLLFIGRM